MSISFRTCGSILVGCFALIELSAGSAQAQGASACVQTCRTGGWSLSQCTRYCQTTVAADANPAARGPAARPPRAYGYYNAPQAYGYAPQAYGYAPQVYGYYRGQGGCGQYRYFRGGQCVDARSDPPNLR